MKSKKLTLGLLIVYLIALVWIILFKFQLSFEDLSRMRSINLIPFAGSVIVNGKVFVKEIIDNALAFIPFGILISSLWEEKPVLKRIMPVFGMSLLFEVLQYVLALGTSDITDLITNTLGGFIGIGIFFILAKVFKEKKNVIINTISLICAVLLIFLLGTLIVVNL